MRAIKFRAYSTKAKRWINPDDNLAIRLNGEIITRSVVEVDGMEGLMDIEITSGLKVMQWTGLKDRNDRDIYEGDIVTVSKYYGSITAVVRFEEGAFIVSAPMLVSGANLGDMLDSTEINVIGNIYENSDLLKEPTS